MEKNLTTEQSLDIIARMISTTRQNFNDRGGAMFLIWGYTTIAVTLAITALFYLTRSNNVMWLWWALPVTGGTLTWLHFRKHPKAVTTHLDKTVWSVWIVFSIATLACALFASIAPMFTDRQLLNVLFTIALMVSMATALTGLMIKFKPVIAGGVAGTIMSFVILIAAPTIWQLPLFAAIFLVAQVIPGHLLNAACKREVREAAKERRAE